MGKKKGNVWEIRFE